MLVIYAENPLYQDSFKRYTTDKTLREWMKESDLDPQDHAMRSELGEVTDLDQKYKTVIIAPILRGGGGSKGKNIFTTVLGIALIAATGGAAAALFGGGASGLAIAHTVGAGLLLSGGGALIMGKMKMPSMDRASEESTKEGYQWNVGDLSTSRGVKGVTFGSDVIPTGELLKFQTYGSNRKDMNSRVTGHHWERGESEWIWVEDRAFYQQIEDSKSYLELLIAAGEGPLDEIKDIRVNDLPVADIPGATVETALGLNNQHIEGRNIDSLLEFKSINQRIPVVTANSRETLVVATPVACKSFTLNLTAPGWFLMNLQDGSKNQTLIDISIRYRKQGTSIWYPLNIAGLSPTAAGIPLKSLEPFTLASYAYPTEDLEPAIYEIELQNKTLESLRAKNWINQDEFTTIPDRAVINLNLDSIACYSADDQDYPGTALIRLNLPASQALNGSLPSVTWKQSRRNIYVRTASGSYETRPANNLSWAIYDIFAQIRRDDFPGRPYHIEGEDPDNLDFNRFESFATFCNKIKAAGNWYLNQTRPAWDHAQDLATSCRAFVAVRNGLISPIWDEETSMTQIFTSGNILEGSLSGGYTSQKDRATAIEATFNDQANEYKSTTLRITADDIDDGSEAIKITFAGLSTAESVYNQARYLLRRNKYLSQTVKFQAAIDSIVSEVGDVIGIQSDIARWGVGGRILAVEGSAISIDTPVNLSPDKTYSLLIRHRDGSLERHSPDESDGIYEILHFSGDPFRSPVDPDDVYSFGVLEAEVKPFRIESISRSSDLIATIEGIEYNPNVYTPGIAPTIDYSRASSGIDVLSAEADAQAGTINVSWQSGSADRAQVYLNGKYYRSTENKDLQIPAINGDYDIKVVPINPDGTINPEGGLEQHVVIEYPSPAAPPAPVIALTELGANLTFYPIPVDQSLSEILIFSSETLIAKKSISGEIVVLDVTLPDGSPKTLTARLINKWDKISQPVSFEVKPTKITAVSIQDNAIITPKLAAGSVTAAKLATDAIKSQNYNYTTGHWSMTGTFLDTANGNLTSPYISWDGAGAYVKASVNVGGNDNLNITNSQITFRHSQTGNEANHIKCYDDGHIEMLNGFTAVYWANPGIQNYLTVNERGQWCVNGGTMLALQQVNSNILTNGTSFNFIGEEYPGFGGGAEVIYINHIGRRHRAGIPELTYIFWNGQGENPSLSGLGWIQSRSTIVEQGTNFIKFGNGFLIQWGTVIIPIGVQQLIITLPKPYVMPFIACASTTDANIPVAAYAEENVTNFAVHRRLHFDYAINVRWIALGWG